MKVYIIGPGHMTKMDAMPIYYKNPFKIFYSGTVSQRTLKLSTQQKGFKLYKTFVNGDPGLTMTYFTAKSFLFI